MSVSPAFSTARSTGRSPLGIFCDATGTTSTLTSIPFHEILYEWGFGDSGASGTAHWPYGADTTITTKNEAEGPLAGHIYSLTEGGGDIVFTITLDVTDGVSTGTVQHTITAYDPIGANGYPNIHIVANGSAAGSGYVTDGNHTVTTHSTVSNFSTVQGFVGDDVMVLVKAGDTYTCGSNGTINHDRWHIGSWGAGAKPIVNATATVNIFDMASSGSGTWEDMRIVDLDIRGNGNLGCYGISALNSGFPTYTAAYDQMTVLRVDISGMQHGIFTEFEEQIFVQDCTAHTSGTAGSPPQYTSFSGGQSNSAHLGNYFWQEEPNGVDNGDGNWRMGGVWNKFVLSHNDFRDACAGRHHVKVHASAGVPNDYFVFSGNKIYEGWNIWQVDFGPQSPGNDELVRNVIVERNWFKTSDFDATGASGWQGSTTIGVVFACTDATARNNLFDMSLDINADGEMNGIVTQRNGGGSPNPNNCRMYNNTAYSSHTNSGSSRCAIVYIDRSGTSPTGNVAKNNYGSFPNWNIKSAVYDPGGVGTLANNTITNTPGWVTSNGIGTGSLTIPSDFKLLSSSAAKGGGTSVPVFRDFFGVVRPSGSGYDQGFAEFDEAPPPTTATTPSITPKMVFNLP